MSFSFFSIQSRIPPGAFLESLSFMILIFEEYCQLFCRIFPNLHLFLMIRVRCALLGGITEEGGPLGAGYQRVYCINMLSTVILTLTPWLKWYLPGFLHCKRAIFPSSFDFDHAHLLLL